MEVKNCYDLKEQSSSGLNDEAQKTARFASLVLLKQKMIRSHELIRQHNDRIKQFNKNEALLKEAQAETIKVNNDYHNTLSKLLKEQLQNSENRKSLEVSARTIDELQAKIAADKQLIQQLTCKIEDNEEKNAEKQMDADLHALKLEEKIKSLEQEIKSLKRSRTTNRKISRKDQSVNTEEVQIVEIETNLGAEAKMLEDRLLGKEFNESIKPPEENSSFILCTKCNIAFEKFIGSWKPPEPMIEPFLSEDSLCDSNLKEDYTEPLCNPMGISKVVEPEHLTDPPKEKHPDSKAIKVLNKTLKTLRLVLENNQKPEIKIRCCHSNSHFQNRANQDLDKDGPSQNRRRKLKRFKNKRKEISKEQGKKKSLENWAIESVNETNGNISFESLVPENQSLIPQRESNSLQTKYLENKIPSYLDNVNILPKEKNLQKESRISNQSLITQMESDKLPSKDLENKISNQSLIAQKESDNLSSKDLENKIPNQSLIAQKESDNLQTKDLENKIPSSLDKVNILPTEKSPEKESRILNQSLITQKESDNLQTKDLENNIPSSLDKVNILTKEKSPEKESKIPNHSLITQKELNKLSANDLNNRIPISLDETNILSKLKNPEEKSKIASQCLIVHNESDNLQTQDLGNKISSSLEEVNTLSKEKIPEEKSKISNETPLNIGRVRSGFSTQIEDTSLETEEGELVSISNEENESISVLVEPEELISVPEESISVPEEFISVPEESISVPEESISVPEESISVPEESISVPEESISVPEELISVPEESISVPEESILVPEESILVSEESISAPKKSISVPEESISVPEESISVPEESTSVPEESISVPEVSKADESTQETEDFKLRESFNDKETVRIQERRMSQSLKRKEVSTDDGFSDSININTSTSCGKSDEDKVATLSSIHNLPVFAPSCKKMVCRKVTSHYPANPLPINLRRNSSVFQSFQSEDEPNLVINSKIKSEEAASGNLEKGKESLKRKREDLENGIEYLENASIELNQVQIPLQESERKIPRTNISLPNPKDKEKDVSFSNTVSSSDNNSEDKLKLPHEETSQEELSNSKSVDMLDELYLSDDESSEEQEKNESFSLPKKTKNQETEDANIFISSSDSAKVSKNFIHGKRSSDLFLPVISPKNPRKRKQKVEVVKNPKAGNRGTLLSKIRTLKRRSNKPVTTSVVRKLEERRINVIKSTSDDSGASNSLIPSKKRRIAHVPRTENDSPPLEVPIRKSLRSASKSPGKVKSFNDRVKSSKEKTKKPFSVNLPEERDNFSDLKMPESPVVRKKGRPKKLVKPPEEIASKESLPEESSSQVDSSKVKEEATIENPSTASNDYSESPLSPDASMDFGNNSISIIKSPSDEDIALSSRITIKNEFWENAIATLNESDKNGEKNEGTFRELRSRPVEVSQKKTPGKRKAQYNFLSLDHRNPMFHLLNNHFIEKKFENSIPKSKLLQKSLEKNVRSHLVRLVESESWTRDLQTDVVEKISEICQASTAAKCILDFLQEKCLDEEPLDKSNTPPAPMMSRTQQKIVTLISGLERLMPEIFDLITSGINFSLFRLGFAPDRCVIEGLARIYTVLARLKKDREKARLLCIDALYCYRINAIILIYVVLTCWPEVFPICNTNPEILPKCMAHVILTTEGCGPKLPKVSALKRLLSDYYQYPKAEYFSNKLAAEFLSALKEKHDRSTDMAILLLGKKEGPDWTYKNIIQGGLLQMIIDMSHPSAYDAFSLLGNLMRSFPADDKEGYISNMVQQLCDLLDSDQGTEDRLEGIATALLSLSKFGNHFSKVAKSLLLWKPRQKKLRDETLKKFNIFSQLYSRDSWSDFIKNGYTMLPPKTKKKKFQMKPNQLNEIPVRRKRTKKAKAKKADASGENVASTSQ